MKLPLSISTLGDLDGGASGKVIDAALNTAVSDLEDRGVQDGKPRKVNITLTLTLAERGIVSIDCEAEAKVPKYRTNPTLAKPSVSSGGEQCLLFQSEAPTAPDQATIDEVVN